MRVSGYVGKQVIHILIDCGSTHNFMDVQTAKRIGCPVQAMCPLQVEVANGNTLTSTTMCRNFKWSLQGVTFVTDMMVIPLGGCEMVLGIQWMSTLGTIKWNFEHLTMEFEYAKTKLFLRGTPQSSLKWMQTGVVQLNSMSLCVYPPTLLSIEEAKGSCTKHPCE